MPSTSCQLAVIPAAGRGERMGSGIPKQYLVYAGKTVLEHSVDKLLAAGITTIVIAVSPEDERWAKLPIVSDKRVHFVSGAATRAESVFNGLKKLLERFSENDWVMVHDAARPCVSVSDIVALNEGLSESEVGGLLAIRISDTIKKQSVTLPNAVECTLERNGLWRALTPQMFRLGMLSRGIINCLEKGVAITDDASAVESIGCNPLLIEGGTENIKITRSGDLKLAEYYLQREDGHQ